jgi:acetyl-CoA acetyltransferase
MEVTRSVSAALLTACNAIQAGTYNTVLVGGIEKMTDRWDKIRDDLMLLEDPWSYYAGGTPEANHELMLRAYMKKYEIKGEILEKLNLALAQIAVKNHDYAIKNEYAQFHRKITVEQVISAREAARKPLGLYDFAPISDGASALILTNSDLAKRKTNAPVYVLGCSSATDYLNFPTRKDLTRFVSAKIAAKNAFEMANVNPMDVQVAELYDQSTLMEMISLEDLGFCEPGTAWKSVRGNCEDYKGYYDINGKKLYVNMNGGLKADGHPYGATGGAQIYELFRQLRGEAGERQVDIGQGLSRLGCALEFEGFGTKAYLSVLGREQH